eukprot:1159433-Pelagomonas_calceolata.AAC.2
MDISCAQLEDFFCPVFCPIVLVSHAGALNVAICNFLATQKVHRLENVVGWYHSHPGYGCWLSGIDCSTQMLNQQFQVSELLCTMFVHAFIHVGSARPAHAQPGLVASRRSCFS